MHKKKAVALLCVPQQLAQGVFKTRIYTLRIYYVFFAQIQIVCVEYQDDTTDALF